MNRSPGLTLTTTTAPTDQPDERLVVRTAGAMDRLASWRVWFVSAVAFAISATVFFRSGLSFSISTVERLCGAPPLDVRLTSTTGDVERFLSGCGIEGRRAYGRMLLADLIYPIVFGLFMASSLALALARIGVQRASLRALPAIALVGSGFDYIENLLAWRALDAFPSPVMSTHLLGVVSAAKTVTFWIAGLAVVALLVVVGLRAARARWRRRTTDMMS
jgi:hypothetical protein